MKADPKYKDYPNKIDKVMKPASEDMVLYKGSPTYLSDLKELK